MGQAKLRVIDPNREHARDLVRRRVKRFRTLVEQENFPICNQHTEQGGSYLATDDILRRSERDMPEAIRPRRYRVNPLVSLFLILFSIVGLVLFINSMR